MYLKVHNISSGNDIVAVCDRELLNTTIRDGEICITISENFYGNTISTEESVIDAMEHASNLNLIGNRVISLANSIGIIDINSCIFINKVPHAQVYRI